MHAGTAADSRSTRYTSYPSKLSLVFSHPGPSTKIFAHACPVCSYACINTRSSKLRRYCSMYLCTSAYKYLVHCVGMYMVMLLIYIVFPATILCIHKQLPSYIKALKCWCLGGDCRRLVHTELMHYFKWLHATIAINAAKLQPLHVYSSRTVGVVY